MGRKRQRTGSKRTDTVQGRGRQRVGFSPAELSFGITLFVSAALLFVVEPMFAKMVLPLLGGSPSAWNTCLVFYQAALLAGYLYAHLSLRWLGPRRQAWLHLVLLCLPWLVLPIGVAEGWVPRPSGFVVGWLWMLLTVSVGMPFLMISSTAPTLQAWFRRTGAPSADDPYFLYAASNFGSLLALLGYPFLIEPYLTLRQQSWTWTAGYALLMMLVTGCAIRLWRSPPDAAEQAMTGNALGKVDAAPPAAARRFHWLALSFVPSSLLLGVTTYISTDLAAIPLLWVIPLALYLLTFVLVFARRTILPLSWMLRLEPYVIVAAAITFAWHLDTPFQLLAIGSLQLLTFSVIAMVCHGQLAADRPNAGHLTEFYLWISLGGVLGGLFNALAAPLLFSSALEYPLMLAAACLLRPNSATAANVRIGSWRSVLSAAVLLGCAAAIVLAHWQGAETSLHYTDSASMKLAIILAAAVATIYLRRRATHLAIGVAMLLVVAWCYPVKSGPLLYTTRSFFGVLRVKEDPLLHAHVLYHGSTVHGSQGQNTRDRHEPWAYYHRRGPLGEIFDALGPRRPLREIGVLGLGAGAIAAYGLPGERITYYEIDPEVERVARDPKYFTYLADSRAKVDVVLGDARLSLVRQSPQRKFDLLVVDVFSSDSVPIHLVTREAFRLYLDRLAEHGLLAIHVSSRFLDLKPIFGRLAKDAGLSVRILDDRGSELGPERLASTWIVMARSVGDMAALVADSRWERLLADGRPVWTDDFSNIAEAIQWRFSLSELRPGAWWMSSADQAEFYNMLGTNLGKSGRLDDAVVQIRTALKIKPNFPEAYSNLGLALQIQGKVDEAIQQFQRAVKLKPDYAQAYYNLGVCLLSKRGDAEGAIRQFEQALLRNPGSAQARRGLEVAKASLAETQHAVDEGYLFVRNHPDDVARLGALARLLAANPNVSIRNGHEAVMLAERAAKLSHRENPDILDTLAAAYAEAGRFAEATGTAQQAVDLARRQNKAVLADALAVRLSLYKAGKQYREWAAKTRTPSRPQPQEQ